MLCLLLNGCAMTVLQTKNWEVQVGFFPKEVVRSDLTISRSTLE